MAIAGRTREQLRIAIGHNLGAVYESSASSVGTTTTLVDNTLRGGDDDHNGKWVIITSGALDGVIRQVSDYTVATTTLTVAPAFASGPASGVTYELWDEHYPIARIHEFINQAILEAYGRVYDPIENITVHADSRTARLAIPTGISMISSLEYREGYVGAIIHNCDTTWAESTDADIVQAADAQDFRSGSALKLTIAGAAAANDFISAAISSLDLSKYTHIEFWAKATAATAAADFHIRLDNTAALASPLETLAVPALSADTWTYVRVALDTPELDTAIISVGFRYTVDVGAITVWLDDIKATNNFMNVWEPLPRHLWRIDKEAREIVLSDAGRDEVGYALLKIVGGDEPALLTAESTANEIDDFYVIAQATALAFGSASGGPGTDPDVLRQQFAFWTNLAERARRAFPMLVNARSVE